MPIMDIREPDLIKCKACGEFVKHPCFFILEIEGCDIRLNSLQRHLGKDDDERHDGLEQEVH